MGYAVELFLKDEESRAIRRLFAATKSVLADIGTSPHISLAVFEDVDAAALIGVVKSFAARISPLAIRFSSIGVFPGSQNVVFLAPVVTASLLSAHETLHVQLMAAGLSCDSYYLPGSWVPHCAITVEEPLADSLETIRQLHAREIRGEHAIECIGVVKFRPVVELARFTLGE